VALTARVIRPGEKYFNGQRIVTVPEGVSVILCEACGDTISIPNRHGPSHAEEQRVEHLTTKHKNDPRVVT
jgi:hypothetical protein